MKRRIFAALLACLLFACAEDPAAHAAGLAAESYVIRDGKACRVTDGKETILEDDEAQFFNTDAGMWGWLLVDPELSEGMKGSKSGIYFFLNDAPVTFLPMEEAGACMMEFSPSGEKLLISRGTEIKQDLGYYVIDIAAKKFDKKKSFVSAGHSFWIDPHRFLFTSVDEKKGKRDKAGDQLWDSVALYDTVFEELNILKEATETKDYFITGYDHDNGTIDVSEGSVKDKKDWNDPDKINYRDITVETPAAG